MTPKIHKKPELVAPAGDWPSLYTAIEYGADSIYFGIKNLNMRNMAENFKISDISKITELLHRNKKKAYLALNTIFFNKELPLLKKILSKAKESVIDAVILWDTAVLSIAKEIGIKAHLSTQASVSNIEAVKFYSQQGIKRIVLARECSLKDISEITKQIIKKKINCEIEAFVHGAMCLSVSGRCFLSEYYARKSANRGKCLQPCRREYDIYDVEEKTNFIIGKDYVLSPKDLCTIGFIDKLIKARIDAFKIEGRMKSAEYIKTVVSSYRTAIDSVFKNNYTEELKKELTDKLKQVFNRGFSKGFYFSDPSKDVSKGLEHTYEKVFLGKVVKYFKKINVAQIKILAEKLNQGDEIIFIGKTTPSFNTVINEIQFEHEPCMTGSKGQEVGIKVPQLVRANDSVYLWRKKTSDKSQF